MTLPKIGSIDNLQRLKDFIQGIQGKNLNQATNFENLNTVEKKKTIIKNLTDAKKILIDVSGNNIILKIRIIDGSSQVLYPNTTSVEAIDPGIYSVCYYQFDEPDEDIQTIELSLNKESVLDIEFKFALVKDLYMTSIKNNMDIQWKNGGAIEITPIERPKTKIISF